MGRPSISEQRRIEIGRALQACMINNGSYESTSVKDIAQQAGLATGLIHHYFNSKDDILFLVADIALLEVSNQLDELLHLKNNADRIELLRETLSNQEQNKFILMLYTLSFSMPRIKEMIIKYREEQLEAVEAILRRKSVSNEYAKEKSTEVVMFFESALIQSPLTDSDAFIPIMISVLEKIFSSVE